MMLTKTTPLKKSTSFTGGSGGLGLRSSRDRELISVFGFFCRDERATALAFQQDFFNFRFLFASSMKNNRKGGIASHIFGGVSALVRSRPARSLLGIQRRHAHHFAPQT